MASVRQRKGSRFWYACITLPAGRQRQFSTGIEDRDEALAVATAAERAANRHHQSPHKLREALDRIVDDFVTVEDHNPGPWLTAWARGRAGEVEADTLATYENTMTEARQWLEGRGVRKFSALTPRVMTELRDYWAARNSKTTANLKIKHLRVALRAAVLEKRIERNPAAEVTGLKQDGTPRREFRPAELEVLLPTLSGEWKAITLLGIYTGQRLNDLSVLRWKNLDLAARTIVLNAKKTGALVALPLMASAVDALLALPAGEDPQALVFPGIAAMARPSRSNTFRTYLAAVGLAPAIDRSKKGNKPTKRQTLELSFHSLRHTATSMLKAAGVSDAIARAIIGHESAAVSRQYTHFDLETMRQAMEKMTVL